MDGARAPTFAYCNDYWGLLDLEDFGLERERGSERAAEGEPNTGLVSKTATYSDNKNQI